MSDEMEIAERESAINEAEDSYFKARPQVDTPHNRVLFVAGFDRGYKSLQQRLSAAREEIDILKRGMVGDYDLDAWLDWVEIFPDTKKTESE